MRASPARRTFLARLCQGGLLAAMPALAFGSERSRAMYPPVPPAYRIVARSLALPPKLFFAIAIQESVMQWGALALPWPWTLNVRLNPRRFQRYPEALTDLKRVLAQGVRNVDCGPMQVNWHYHADKLRTPELALDPWHNLRVAGAILLDGLAYPTLGFWLRHGLPRLLKFGKVLRLLVSRRSGGPSLSDFRDFPTRSEARRMLAAMVERDARLLFVFTGGAYGYFNHRAQLPACLGRAADASQVRLEFWREYDHTFYLPKHRRVLVSCVCRWMKEQFPHTGNPP